MRLLLLLTILLHVFFTLGQQSCRTNSDCSGRTLLTNSINQNVLCGCEGNQQYWFEYEVVTPTDLEFSGLSLSFDFEIYGPFQNQTIIDCIDIGLNQSDLWLSGNSEAGNLFTAQLSFSGIYIIKLIIPELCPSLNVNIEGSSCPSNGENFLLGIENLEDNDPNNDNEDILLCSPGIDICEDYIQEISCNCSQQVYWYNLSIDQALQELNVSVVDNNGQIQSFFLIAFDIDPQISFPCSITDLNENPYDSFEYNYPADGISTPPIVFNNIGNYLVAVVIEEGTCDGPSSFSINLNLTPDGTCISDCENCIGSFAPGPEGQDPNLPEFDGRYVVGAWVKEKNAPLNKETYNYPKLKLTFDTPSGQVVVPDPLLLPNGFRAQGTIIDGWQRIENEFTMPQDATNIKIEMICETGECYFDDIRFFPFDASMKTYVYDPVFMRLAAELDERHYTTFYEYNEEGQLTRIKKETEKGIYTIQETRNNSSKKDQ